MPKRYDRAKADHLADTPDRLIRSLQQALRKCESLGQQPGLNAGFGQGLDVAWKVRRLIFAPWARLSGVCCCPKPLRTSSIRCDGRAPPAVLGSGCSMD